MIKAENFLRVGWLTPLIHDTINNSQFLKYSLRIFQTLGAQRADWEKVASNQSRIKTNKGGIAINEKQAEPPKMPAQILTME